MNCMVRSTLAALLLTAAAGCSSTQAAHESLPGRGVQSSSLRVAVVCGPGQAVCGTTCYSTASGQTCSRGLVCSPGLRACLGPFGNACYSPAAGQSCTEGLVCGPGQAACISQGSAQCYSPSAGQTCH
jgi:hypothetical protein